MSSAQTQQGVVSVDDSATSTSRRNNNEKKRGGAGTDGTTTPPPLPQGEVDTGLSPGNNIRSMGEDSNDNASMISAESSSSAEAMLATTPVHAAKPIIPGPFVVFQGIPGDGMGNTIDSCPMLQYHACNVVGSANSRAGSRIGSRAGSRAGSRRGSFAAGTTPSATSVSAAASSGRTLMQLSSVSTPTNTRSRPTTSTSMGLGEEEEEGAVFPSPARSTATSLSFVSAAQAEESQFSMDDSMEGSESSRSSSHSSISSSSPRDNFQYIHNNGPTPGARAAMEAGCGATPTEGGLHLPIPPSMIPRCGTVLPPLVPVPESTLSVASAASANVARSSTATSRVRADTNATTATTDSYVVVDGASGPSPRQPRRTVSYVPSYETSTPTQSATNSPGATNTPTTLDPTELRAIREWSAECREREARQRDDVLLELRQREITTSSFATSHRGDGGSSNTPPSSPSLTRSRRRSNRYSETFSCYMRNGHLVVMSSLPVIDDNGEVNPGDIIGYIAPGAAVTAVEMIPVDSATFQLIANEPTDDECCLRFLLIDSPIRGYVLYSDDGGYTLLGPGLPTSWAQPEVWVWRVTCPDGALVRDGLELTANHVDTVPYGSFVKVTRKTVNSMGLCRLRVEAVLHKKDKAEKSQQDEQSSGEWDGQASSPFRLSLMSNDENELSSTGPSSEFCNPNGDRTIVGWVSECLNPLSGQRGPVVQPVSFPVPMHYCVTLAEGAVIRSDVELSSGQIGHAPVGSVLTIVGRAFSEHPTDQCVERLRLAGGGGWISVRLNRPPPLDEVVVELVGVDDCFDPNDPGAYHLKEQAEMALQNNSSGPPNSLVSRATARLTRTMSTAELSSINDGDDSVFNDQEPVVGIMPTLFRSSVGGGAAAGAPPGREHETCLICLTDERNATIVHGGTGHIACCLGCARILKARGDKCPVCRLPIDTVIQQFWA